MNCAEVLDFTELERELANAVAADEKYRRENDAKFRAIHQKVASYEEFRYGPQSDWNIPTRFRKKCFFLPQGCKNSSKGEYH